MPSERARGALERIRGRLGAVPPGGATYEPEPAPVEAAPPAATPRAREVLDRIRARRAADTQAPLGTTATKPEPVVPSRAGGGYFPGRRPSLRDYLERAAEIPEDIRQGLLRTPPGLTPLGEIQRRVGAGTVKAAAGLVTLPAAIGAQLLGNIEEEGPLAGTLKTAIDVPAEFTGIPGLLEQGRRILAGEGAELGREFLEDPVATAMPAAMVAGVVGGTIPERMGLREAQRQVERRAAPAAGPPPPPGPPAPPPGPLPPEFITPKPVPGRREPSPRTPPLRTPPKGMATTGAGGVEIFNPGERRTVEQPPGPRERRGPQAPIGARDLEFTAEGEVKEGPLKTGEVLWPEGGELKRGKYQGQVKGPAQSVILEVRDADGNLRHFQVREGETRVLVEPKPKPEILADEGPLSVDQRADTFRRAKQTVAEQGGTPEELAKLTGEQAVKLVELPKEEAAGAARGILVEMRGAAPAEAPPAPELFRGGPEGKAGQWYTTEEAAAKEYADLHGGGKVSRRRLPEGKIASRAEILAAAQEVGAAPDQALYWLVSPEVSKDAPAILENLRGKGFVAVHLPKGEDFAPSGKGIESYRLLEAPPEATPPAPTPKPRARGGPEPRGLLDVAREQYAKSKMAEADFAEKPLLDLISLEGGIGYETVKRYAGADVARDLLRSPLNQRHGRKLISSGKGRQGADLIADMVHKRGIADLGSGNREAALVDLLQAKAREYAERRRRFADEYTQGITEKPVAVGDLTSGAILGRKVEKGDVLKLGESEGVPADTYRVQKVGPSGVKLEDGQKLDLDPFAQVQLEEHYPKGRAPKLEPRAPEAHLKPAKPGGLLEAARPKAEAPKELPPAPEPLTPLEARIKELERQSGQWYQEEKRAYNKADFEKAKRLRAEGQRVRDEINKLEAQRPGAEPIRPRAEPLLPAPKAAPPAAAEYIPPAPKAPEKAEPFPTKAYESAGALQRIPGAGKRGQVVDTQAFNDYETALLVMRGNAEDAGLVFRTQHIERPVPYDTHILETKAGKEIASIETPSYRPAPRPGGEPVEHGPLSPSGRVSERTREATVEKARQDLVEGGDLAPKLPKQPSGKEADLRRAKELRELAARGQNPKAYIAEAERLEARWETVEDRRASAWRSINEIREKVKPGDPNAQKLLDVADALEAKWGSTPAPRPILEPYPSARIEKTPRGRRLVLEEGDKGFEWVGTLVEEGQDPVGIWKVPGQQGAVLASPKEGSRGGPGDWNVSKEFHFAQVEKYRTVRLSATQEEPYYRFKARKPAAAPPSAKKMPSFEQVKADMIAAQEAGAAKTAEILELAPGQATVRLISPDKPDRSVVVHPATYKDYKGQWQVTWFDGEGPAGHIFETTKEKAVKEALDIATGHRPGGVKDVQIKVGRELEPTPAPAPPPEEGGGFTFETIGGLVKGKTGPAEPELPGGGFKASTKAQLEALELDLRRKRASGAEAPKGALFEAAEEAEFQKRQGKMFGEKKPKEPEQLAIDDRRSVEEQAFLREQVEKGKAEAQRTGGLAAWKEKPSDDPITGVEGVLRDEWRVRKVKPDMGPYLRNQFGDQTMLKEYVLEHRYIRRGVEEPWTPSQMGNTREAALGYIDDAATAVDPALVKLQEGRKQYAAEQKAKATAEAEKKEKSLARYEQMKASREAFERMLQSKDPRFSELAKEYNATVERVKASKRLLAAAKEDQVVRDLQQAVFDATTVPTKAKAMRSFLDGIVDFEKRLKARKVAAEGTDIFRGYGREGNVRAGGGTIYTEWLDKEGAHTGGPVLGPGKYFAFEPGVAVDYGPQLERRRYKGRETTLRITNDREWRAFTDAALRDLPENVQYPNPAGLDRARMKQWAEAIHEELRRRGVTSVEIRLPRTSEGHVNEAIGKTIDRVFGEDQVYIPPWSEGAKVAPEAKTDLVFGAPMRRAAQPAPAPTPQAPKATGPPIGPHDVREYLERRLLVPIRKGLHPGLGKRLAGVYKRRPRVIRIADVIDLPNISHEIGHHLDELLDLTKSASPQAQGDLVAAGKRLYPDPAAPPPAGYRREGVAEFTNFMLTDPARAASEFPTYHAEFTKRLAAHPDALETLQEARSMIERIPKQPFTAQALAQMSIGKSRSRPMTLERLKEGAVDDLAALQRVGREMERENPQVKTEAYDRAMAHRLASGIAEEMLTRRMINNKGQTVGPGYEQIIKPVVRRLDDLRAYLLAQATKERLPLGKHTGLSMAQADGVLRELAAKPGFATLEKAADNLYRFKDQFLQYMVDEGLVSADSAAAMRATYQKHAPLYREKPLATSTEAPGLGGLMNRIKRARGGTERIIDPLENIAKDIVENVNAASRNRVRKALLNDARKAKGSGRFVEPDMPMPMEAIRPVIENVIAELEKQGIQVDTTNTPPDVLASRLLMFNRAPWRYRGRTYSVAMEEGKPTFMAIHDEPLYRALEQLDHESPGAVIKALNYPVRLLKAGTVEYNPAFGIANFLIDQWTLATNTKHGTVPFIDPARAIGDILGNSKAYERFRARGLESATFNRYGRNMGQEVLKRATRGRRSFRETPARAAAELAGRVVLSPFRAARRFNQVLESASRLAEDKRADAARVGDLQSLRDAQEVTVNFNRIGHASRALNMISAFYNPGLQGTARFFRAVKENPKRVATVGAGVATASAILYAINANDPEYEKLHDWRKDRYWHIPTGTGERHGWIVIKKPRVLGAMFGSNTEQVMEFLKKGDPEGFARVQNDLLWELLPGTGGAPLPNALVVPVEWWGNKSLWTGQPSVPRSKVDLLPAQQYRSTTGPTARALGTAGGFSPAKAEQAVRGATGGVGVDTLRLLDVLGRKLGPYPAQLPGEQRGDPLAPERLPIVSRFFYRRPEDESALTDKDWKMRQEGERLLNSLREIRRTGTPADLEAFRRKYGAKLQEYLKQKKALDQKFRQERPPKKPMKLRDVVRYFEGKGK